MSEDVKALIGLLSKKRFSLEDEKVLQAEIHLCIPDFVREYRFNNSSIIDFYNKDNKIGIEVKISGSTKKQIYRQCLRYCSLTQLSFLLVLTNKSLALPNIINDTPTAVLNLGSAWL